MRLFSQILSIAGAAALYLSTTYADLASYSPIDGITYSAGIPMSTTNSGSGDIYLRIRAPTTFRWVAMGIGQGMAGATIFLMYASGDGNVTISPRLGLGHVMPLFNPAAQVTLLEGSGVANGFMTANVKYVAAQGLLSLSSTSAGFIGSYQMGDALNTTDKSAFITQHDNYAIYTLDLAQAQLSDDSNPFLDSTGSGSNQTSTSSGSAVAFVDPVQTYEMIHGPIMAASMVVLFPLGAIILRVGLGVWLHAAFQLFSLACIIVGFGLGIHLAMISDLLFNNTHTLFGTTIVCLFLVQPFLGLLHHRQYLKLHRRSYFGWIHIWYGRILIICGIINGALGLQLAANTVNGEIAYGIVVAVMFILYIGVLFVTDRRKREAKKREASSL